MNERIAHQMETDLVRDRGHLANDRPKELNIHDPFCPNHFRAETALEITDITDLDVDLLVLPHGPFSNDSRGMSMAESGYAIIEDDSGPPPRPHAFPRFFAVLDDSVRD